MTCQKKTGEMRLTSSVALVYTAVSFLVNGVYLLLPEALMAAVSICRTTPTWFKPTSEDVGNHEI